MAGIADGIRSILAALAAIPVVNGDGATTIPYVRVWKNQIHRLEAGELEAFPMPAFFLEISGLIDWQSVGQGVNTGDPDWTIHIAHEFYDAGDGTMEQDLAVFDLRDTILNVLTLFQPTGGGPWECKQEEHDINNKNIYHLILKFRGHFIDYAGSRINPSTTKFQYKEPPTPIVITADPGKGGSPVQRDFQIPSRTTLVSVVKQINKE